MNQKPEDLVEKQLPHMRKYDSIILYKNEVVL